MKTLSKIERCALSVRQDKISPGFLGSFWAGGSFGFVAAPLVALAVAGGVLLGLSNASAVVVSSDRLANWMGNAGVPGGIPNRTTIFCNATNPPYNARGDGVTDNQTAIQNSINACPSNQVVYLPAGNYRVNGQVYIGTRSYWTLRGEGPGKTIITGNPTSGQAIFYLGSSPWMPPANANMVSGFTKGSTNIVLSSVSGIAPNILLYLDQLNDGTLVTSYGASIGHGPCTYLDRFRNGTRNVMQIVRVTSIVGNSINFWPPLNWTFSASLSPQVAEMYASVRFAGIEDLTITAATNSDVNHHIYFDACESSWLKNIESVKAPHWHVRFYTSLNCEIRDSYIHEAQTYGVDEGYGVEGSMSTGLLIENNVFWRNALATIMGACNGSVIGYNYETETLTSDTAYMQAGFFACHGAHPFMNLYEGNVGNEYQTDFYWGSSSHQTLFRNWFTGTDVGVLYNHKAVSLDSHSISNNVVGNVLGSTGLTWAYENETSGFSQNVIWRLGFPIIGNNTYTNVSPPATNAEALDMRVKATLLRHGNYDFATHAISWDTNIADHTLPASLYLTNKPAWFGDRPWPPFDPATASTAAATNIPAGYRFVFGTVPPQPPTQLHVTAVTNGWSLSFNGTPGSSYQVQRATNVTGVWLVRATVLADTNGSAVWVDTNAPTTRGFYRVNLP